MHVRVCTYEGLIVTVQCHIPSLNILNGHVSLAEWLRRLAKFAIKDKKRRLTQVPMGDRLRVFEPYSCQNFFFYIIWHMLKFQFK
jgi:hypothetical protein